MVEIMAVQGSGVAGGVIVSDGPYEGWEHVPHEPFNDTAGPFYHRRTADGSLLFGFTPLEKASNKMGIVHGGCLLTFADYCLFLAARERADPHEIVTVSMASEFVGMAIPGEAVEGRTEIIRGGRSLIFVRGLINGPNGPLLNFSGVAKVMSGRQ